MAAMGIVHTDISKSCHVDLTIFSKEVTLQETNISHLGKRKIIFKTAVVGDMVVPRRVFISHMVCTRRERELRLILVAGAN